MPTAGTPESTDCGVPMYVSALRAASSAVLLKQPGDVVYREGADADALYIVLSGHAACHVAGESGLTDFLQSSVAHHATLAEAPHVHGPVLYSEAAAAASASAAVDAAAACEAAGEAMPPGLGHIVRFVRAGCIAGGHACFVGLPHRETLTAVTQLEVAVITRRMFALLAEADPSALHVGRSSTLLQVALAVGRSLVPLLRMFLSLGLQRLWLRSGQTLFAAGDRQDGLYVVISGRLRTQTMVRRRTRVLDTRPTVYSAAGGSAPSGAGPEDAGIAGEEESDDTDALDDDDAGDGTPGLDEGGGGASSVPPQWRSSLARPTGGLGGAPAAAPTRTKQLRFADAAGSGGGQSSAEPSPASPLARTPSKRVLPPHEQGGSVRVDVGRGETVGELAVLVRARARTSTAVCVRDCELVRISQGGFALISGKYPTVMLHL